MKKLHLFIFIILSVSYTSCGNNGSNTGAQDGYTPEEFSEKWEDCEACNGRGYFSNTCSTCDGSGRITSKYSKTNTRTCQTCSGTGIAPCVDCGNYGYHTCSVCNSTIGKVRCSSCKGTGKLAYNFGGEIIYSECGLCGGSGYATCSNCGGKGRVTCSSCWGEGHIKCRTCNGTGGPNITYSETNDAGPCPTCNGAGKIKTMCEECDGEGKIKVE